MQKVNPKLYGDLKDWKNQPLFVKQSDLSAAEMTPAQWKMAEEEEAWANEQFKNKAFVEANAPRSPSRHEASLYGPTGRLSANASPPALKQQLHQPDEDEITG